MLDVETGGGNKQGLLYTMCLQAERGKDGYCTYLRISKSLTSCIQVISDLHSHDS